MGRFGINSDAVLPVGFVVPERPCRIGHPLNFLERDASCIAHAGSVDEGAGMERSARVVLAIEAPEVLDEVLHFLDRSGAVRVVATADDERQLTDAATQLEPDLVIAEPRFAGQVPATTPCVAIASRESVAALRAAISAGVKAFTVWPEERDMPRARPELLGRREGPRAARDGARGPRLARRRRVHIRRDPSGSRLATLTRSVVLVDVDPVRG
jgi:hypothetical protein